MSTSTPNYSIQDIYVNVDSNPFMAPILGMALSANPQEDQGMFFSRLGMVGKMTGDTFTGNSPIQHMTRFQNLKSDKIRLFLEGFMKGEPRIGDDEDPKEAGQTLDRSYFEMKVVQAYAPPLDVPINDDNRVLSVPILANYLKSLRDWWSNFTEESITIFGITGMRGEGNNYEVYTTMTTDGNAELQGQTAGQSKIIRKMANTNPVYTPTYHFDTWASEINPAATSNPSAATSSDTLDSSTIETVATILQSQHRMKDGFVMKPGDIRLPAKYQVGSEKMGYQNSKRTDWTWMISPSVKHDLIKNTGDGTWAKYQDLLVQSVGRSTVYDNHYVGRIYGINFLEWAKMPAAYGGSADNVPITRTVILGGQAVCIATTRQTVSGQFLARFNQRTAAWGGSFPLSVRLWTVPIKQGEKALLRSESSIGIVPLHWTNPNESGTPRRDRGRGACDAATSSIDGSKFAA